MTPRGRLMMFPAGLVLGCLAGWCLRGNDAGSVKHQVPGETKARSERAAAMAGHETRWRSFARSVTEMDERQRIDFVANLAAKDRAGALEALAAEAGPDGLPYWVTEMMKAILKQWAAEDFHSAWAWSFHMEPERMEDFIKCELLAVLFSNDRERAMVIYKQQIDEHPKSTSLLSNALVGVAVGEGADAFLYVLGRFSPAGDEGERVSFPGNFDFRHAAEGIEMMMESSVGGQQPPYVPGNFRSEWSARDLSAANEWIVGGGPPSGTWLNDVYRVADRVLGAEEAAAWMAGEISNGGDLQDDMIGHAAGFNSKTTGLIGAALPDAALRDRFYSEVIRSGSGSLYRDEVILALSGLSSTKVRLDALKKVRRTGWDDLQEIDDAIFRQWGFTREELEETVRQNQRPEPPGDGRAAVRRENIDAIPGRKRRQR